MSDSHRTDALLCAEFVTPASHILPAQQGIRASRPAAHLKRTGESGLARPMPLRCAAAVAEGEFASASTRSLRTWNQFLAGVGDHPPRVGLWVGGTGGSNAAPSTRR